MIKLIITSVLIFQIVFVTHAQDIERSLRFDTIGWTVDIPLEFEIMNLLDEKNLQNKGNKAIKETLDITVDTSRILNLFTAVTGRTNFFTATIEEFGNDNIEWTKSNQWAKSIILKAFKKKMPDASFDTLTTTAKIDGIDFSKFRMIAKVDGNFIFNYTTYWRLYKGFDFAIGYICNSDKWIKELDECILKSKLSKN